MSTGEEKFSKARCRMITKEPFYGNITMGIVWKPYHFPHIENENAKSIGFKIIQTGEIHGLFYPPWAERTPLREIYGIIEHSINHLIRLHTVRCGSRDRQAWGIACDMAVNGWKRSPHIGYREDKNSTIILPHEDMIFVPEKWDNNQTAEWYYEKIMEQAGKGKDKDGKPDPNVESGNCAEDEFQYGQFGGKSLDDHDIWQQTEVSQDDARQVVSDMVKDAAANAGTMPGHLQDAIEALNKPIVRWRELLRRYLGNHVGNRRRTWSRRDRRFSKQFGKKGISRHAASTVVVIVDTSGSIRKEELEQFFAEIEAISYKAKVYVLQWDADFQGFDKYRRGDWKKIVIGGRGGTNMVTAFQWAEENAPGFNVVVNLTDGYTPWPDERPYPAMFVITNPEGNVEGPGWGMDIRMKVHE